MKIILSHDVDHLYWTEHYLKDMALPFYLYRNINGLLAKRINSRLFFERLKTYGRMHRLPELMDFYDDHNLKASFFFGMDNGLRLSYNYKSTAGLIKELIDRGHEVGVHGIEIRKRQGMLKEFNRFKEISGLNAFGIRTHYLRLSGYTHQYFSDLGYQYDSSVEAISNPFKVDQIWEFPISIMDASLVPNAQFNQNIEIWKNKSKAKIEKAIAADLNIFVVNFHDLYFNPDLYPTTYEWYIWLVDYLIDNKFEFSFFSKEADLLNSNK